MATSSATRSCRACRRSRAGVRQTPPAAWEASCDLPAAARTGRTARQAMPKAPPRPGRSPSAGVVAGPADAHAPREPIGAPSGVAAREGGRQERVRTLAPDLPRGRRSTRRWSLIVEDTVPIHPDRRNAGGRTAVGRAAEDAAEPLQQAEPAERRARDRRDDHGRAAQPVDYHSCRWRYRPIADPGRLSYSLSTRARRSTDHARRRRITGRVAETGESVYTPDADGGVRRQHPGD